MKTDPGSIPCPTSPQMSRPKRTAWGVLPLAVLAAAPWLTARAQPAALDGGGRRAASPSYTVDGSLGSLTGTAVASAPAVVARHGYAGQLYDLHRLALEAAPPVLNEGGTAQLTAFAVLDDATVLALAPAQIAWSVTSGPIASIGAPGIAAAALVYQDSPATVRASYQSIAGTLTFVVLNVGQDDFPPYAGDGLEDAWQVQHFGLDNPNAAPNADPDSDGVNNRHEFTADTDPADPRSFFRIQGVSLETGFSTRFQSSAKRRYTLFFATESEGGAWTSLPQQTDVAGTGDVLTLTDSTPRPGPQRFYRVRVTAQ
ncbi:MAG: hypothetical protein FJ387_19550 [Verrucomicrobia bacterium]|nr:hypothetical protein [Verrucomicrobiota bacterium]